MVAKWKPQVMAGGYPEHIVCSPDLGLIIEKTQEPLAWIRQEKLAAQIRQMYLKL